MNQPIEIVSTGRGRTINQPTETALTHGEEGRPSILVPTRDGGEGPRCLPVQDLLRSFFVPSKGTDMQRATVVAAQQRLATGGFRDNPRHPPFDSPVIITHIPLLPLLSLSMQLDRQQRHHHRYPIAEREAGRLAGGCHRRRCRCCCCCRLLSIDALPHTTPLSAPTTVCIGCCRSQLPPLLLLPPAAALVAALRLRLPTAESPNRGRGGRGGS